jgi:hypothetical protein
LRQEKRSWWWQNLREGSFYLQKLRLQWRRDHLGEKVLPARQDGLTVICSTRLADWGSWAKDSIHA